jgi:tripartite-type tricarboxylate transporter receptor subunit TctC
MHRGTVTICAAALAVLTSLPAAADTPIRIVAGMAAGGAPDAYARLVAERMSVTLKRPVIVENKPGAGGNLAAQVVLDAPSDGQTLWLSTAAQSEINPSVYSKLKWTVDDFAPVIKGVEAPLVLVTHPSVPAKTLAELVTWLKSNSEKRVYASYGPGTPSHFLGHLLNQQFGLDLAHTPYRGSGPQAQDLVAGHVLLGFAQVQTSLPQVKANRLNAIAITAPARSRLMPDVPTFAELGHSEFTASIWFGLMARAGTPKAVMDRLVSAAKEAHGDRLLKGRLEQEGFDVPGQTGPEQTSEIKAQVEKWAKVVKATGFRAD